MVLTISLKLRVILPTDILSRPLPMRCSTKNNSSEIANKPTIARMKSMPYHQVQAANYQHQHQRQNGRKSFGAYRFRATERLGPLLGNPAIGNGKYQQAQAENTITKARHFSNPISRERVSMSFTWA